MADQDRQLAAPVVIDLSDTDKLCQGGLAVTVELKGENVYLNYRQLRLLPRRLFDDDIRLFMSRLYMKYNFLRSLPPEIKRLQHLRELYVNHNGLDSLPEELFELPFLDTLGVSNNQLTSIPRSICRLRGLKRLQVNKNCLQQLPAEIGSLRQLRWLEISHNQLHRLPSQLGQCSNLQQLCVDSNQLVLLPRQLCHLSRLTEISACQNQLVSLPQDLGRIAALHTVYVDNNSFLPAVPASTLHKTIGFCKSGESAIPEHLLTLQKHICLGSGKEDDKLIPLPPEIRCANQLCSNAVPMLLEMTMRLVFKLIPKSVSATSTLEGEVPSELTSVLHTPTAHCQHCGTPVFVSAFPVVFRAQVQTSNLLLLGLCCSLACVRQCSLVVHLPLLYPRLEDLALALVLV